jgi:excisionase family DNA binding protein
MNETWGINEAAAFLRIHADTLAERARAGEIPGTKIGRAWVFMPKLLTEYLEARCTANIRPAPPKHSLAERLAARRAQMMAGQETAAKRRRPPG